MALKLSYHSQKACINDVFPNVPKKRNVTTLLLILIAEYSQSNVNLVFLKDYQYNQSTVHVP